jgi:ABC-type Fe3+/spermidine/putrescine transport system ATPase subunit
MIRIRNLCIELGDFTLKNANIEVAEGEYMVVVGPSGAGKTVLLESIAGLYPIRQGQIWLRGDEATRLEPERRGVSIVYQDHALFPHLSVQENILFGLKMRKTGPDEIKKALAMVVDLFDISSLLHRRPLTLSGGERQKVALARALSVHPDVLLLDEPLSALDPRTRETVQEELHRLHRTLRITTLHVTHDFEEAIALGERIVVIGDGEIKQVGPPEEIFRRPNSEFVARFAMSRNIFPGAVLPVEVGKHRFRSDQAIFTVADGSNGGDRAAVRPEDVFVSLDPSRLNEDNAFWGEIIRITDRGSTLYVAVDMPPVITALMTRNTFREMGLAVGMRVSVSFNASSVHVFQA